MNADTLKRIHLREDGEEYDLKMSYSKLSTFENCKQSYKLHYVDGIMPENDKTLALEIGTLCHKCLELIGDSKIAGMKIDWGMIGKVLEKGYTGTNVNDREVILGIDDLQKKYGFEEWYKADDQGKHYGNKMRTFMDEVLPAECCINESEWKVFATEEPFEFIYEIEVPIADKDILGKDKFKVLFNGFIDRIDVKGGGDEKIYRVIDYKTSKKPFPEKNLPTALQMFIYGLAIYLKYSTFPSEYKYSFILINDYQYALTAGYVDRGFKKIDKLFVELMDCMAKDEWPEKPSPLCHWCAYCNGREVVDSKTNGLCSNYSLWTPDNHTFETSNGSSEYDKYVENRNERETDTKNCLKKTKRKLIF